jgi:hypothetical protein
VVALLPEANFLDMVIKNRRRTHEKLQISMSLRSTILHGLSKKTEEKLGRIRIFLLNKQF